MQRSLSYLDANNIGRYKLRLIVNRYDRHTGLSKDVIGTALHIDIFHIMPSDYEAIQKSLMEGKPLGHATSFGKSVVQLADRLAGSAEQPRKAVRSRVFSRCSRVRLNEREARASGTCLH